MTSFWSGNRTPPKKLVLEPNMAPSWVPRKTFSAILPMLGIPTFTLYRYFWARIQDKQQFYRVQEGSIFGAHTAPQKTYFGPQDGTLLSPI